MAETGDFTPEGESDKRQTAYIVAGALLLALLLWFVYDQLTQPVTKKVKTDETVMAAPDLLPPPPPPPPPPPEPQEKPPEPTEAPTPEPAEPAPSPDTPAPMTMNAAPSAGAGSLAAGGGGGMGGGGSTGTCLKPPCGGGGGGGFSDALYRGNLARDLQDRILDNDKVNRLAFRAVFAITVSAAGQVTSVQLLNSTGDAKRDEILLGILKSARGLEAPPSQVRFPQRVTVTGRRSF